MTKPPESSSGSSPNGQTSQEARAERQAKSLRDNLRRRKQQARGRDTVDRSDDPDSPESQDKPE